MSTLVAQTISNGTVSTSSANVIQGSAKAWANLNGTAATVRASYNVSSITRNSTGRYVVNMTNAMPDANYAVVALSRDDNGWNVFLDNGGTYSTTQFAISTYSASYGDTTTLNIAVFR